MVAAQMLKPRALLAVTLLALGLAGCGEARQDAGEPRGAYTLEVLRASFPSRQAVSTPSALTLEVRNPGPRTVPNLTVSVSSFYYRSEYPNLADRARPIWIVDQGPGAVPQRPVQTVPFDSPGSDLTATEGTWAAGPLRPGEARTLTWQLTPVKAGVHTVAYSLAAGLNGRAAAQRANGEPLGGRFTVDIAAAPPIKHVNPETGLLEAGRPPVVPGP
jgi:hypothetical protein